MIFVTGATGFLGHHLIPALTTAGYGIRALVRSTSDTEFLKTYGNVELVVGDVQDRDSILNAMEGCRYVIHAGGLFRFWGNQKWFEQINVQGTANVLECAIRNDVERVVHVSTVAVIGIPNGHVIDETYRCEPADYYQRSKFDAENLVRLYHQASRLPVIILRPGAFYGPWGHYAWNRLFFEDPLKHKMRVQIHGGRRLTFPVFVPDVAQAILAALDRGQPGETYNVSGQPIKHKDANHIISNLAGISSFRLNCPAPLMMWLANYLTERAGRTGREPFYPVNLAKYVFYDWPISSDKAQAELCFTPTPFEDGARQTVEWYRKIGWVK